MESFPEQLFAENLTIAEADTSFVGPIVQLLLAGDVGLAIVNIPDSKTQTVVWYLLNPDSPSPVQIPIYAAVDGDSKRLFSKSVYRQIAEAERKATIIDQTMLGQVPSR
ncbi:MAG: hypothetical protein RIK87_24260 [Fuerstiella sp.]